MNRLIICTLVSLLLITTLKAQDMVSRANTFLNTLDSGQKMRTLYPFDVDERYNFHFFPKDDRKGITMNELSEPQKKAAMDLMKTCLSDQAVKKITTIFSLENVLKALEKRAPEDHFRDSGKYYFTIFGIPSAKTVWGWRFEGHHVSFNFSADKNQLVSGTPGFLGSNPGIVQNGPMKGTQVLKDEADAGFNLLHSLTPEQLKKAINDTLAPNEIVTFISRKASLQQSSGLHYSEMTQSQQQQFLALVNLYVHRYTKIFADQMLKEIQQAGLNNLTFMWAGFTQPEVGKAHYYRIQGPTLIIEYDNSQNNANHVHTVVRDLLNDFGGDLLLEHYKASHS